MNIWLKLLFALTRLSCIAPVFVCNIFVGMLNYCLRDTILLKLFLLIMSLPTSS